MENETVYNSPKDWLENRIERKIKNNPAFSLRAFARVVNLSPSYLSRVISGERKLTIKTATTLSNSLGLDPKERKELFELILKDQNTKPINRVKPIPNDESMQLTLEAFKVISDWYHYGIMQLFYLDGFKSDPIWIAKTLQIKPLEAKLALIRLEKLGLIKKDKNGKLFRTEQSLATPNEVASASLRNFQRQILEKAIISLDQDPLEKRDITSITVATNEANLKKVKEEIKKFRKRIAKILFKGKKTRIYNLGVHLIPISKSNQETIH